MKRISIGAVLASCMLALALGGCSGSASTPASSADADSLKGFWELEESSQVGFDAVLNLDEDNLAELVVAEGFLEGEWTTDGQNAQIVFEDIFGDSEDSSDSSDAAARTAKISVSDNKLTLGSPDGSRLVFVKGDIDAYYAEENASDGTASDDGDMADLGDLEDVEVVDPVIEDINSSVIADDDTVTIKVTGKGTDYLGDPCYRLSITNKSQKAIDVESSDELFKVGSGKFEAILGEVVEAGETLDDVYLSFSVEDVSGVDKLADIAGDLVVSDDDTGDEISTLAIKIK